ncbi:MAG: hypothetical protein Q9217_006701 [Psora testacea]
MTIPKLGHLRPGVGVNIVLKADQATGKLTTGQVADILTRGDHPRGVKVRLGSGQVGRVQSLSSVAPTMESSSQIREEQDDFDRPMTGNGGRGQGWRGRRRPYMQEDYRHDDIAAESRSLADYMKVSRKTFPHQASAPEMNDDTIQAQLESEFPKLDTALIAAIIADHGSMNEARNVLNALS